MTRHPARAALVGLAVVVASALAAVLVVDGLSRLGEAHRYRQRTGEGLLFFQVGLRVAPAAALALAATTLAWATQAGRGVRTVAATGGAAAVVAVGATAVVLSRGTACFGPC
ncbi:MAG: hypothetical protein AAGA17_04340 [Actinomycetota bacterium]